MKKFLDKFKKALSFKKRAKSSNEDDELVDVEGLEEYEDDFLGDDSPTDPNIELPVTEIFEPDELEIEITQPEHSIPEEIVSSDIPPTIQATDADNDTVFLNMEMEDEELPDQEIQTPPTSQTTEINNLGTDEKPLSFDTLESDELDELEADITDPNFVQMPQPTLLTKVKKILDKTTTSLFKRNNQGDTDSDSLPEPITNSDDSINLDFDDLEDDQGLLEQKPHSFKDKFLGFLPSLKTKTKKTSSSADQPISNIPKDSESKLSFASFSGLGFFHWLFSVEARPRLHKGFLLIIWLLIFFSLGKFSGLFLNGTKVKKVTSRSSGAPIEVTSLSRKLFNKLASQDIFKAARIQEVKKEKKVEKIDKDEICLKANKQSKFKSFYYLFNTIVLKNSKKSIASFQMRSDPNLLEIREGGKIDDRFRVDRISRLRVIGKNLNTNECEFFENEKVDKKPIKIKTLSKKDSTIAKKKLKKIQGIQNDGNKVKIKRTFLNEQLSNISGLLKQALAIPINNPDGSVAFRITDIEPGSIYSYLNIENGDTITEINGNKIATQNEVLSLFSKLKTVKKLQLTVKRGGTPQQLDYTFE